MGAAVGRALVLPVVSCVGSCGVPAAAAAAAITHDQSPPMPPPPHPSPRAHTRTYVVIVKDGLEDLVMAQVHPDPKLHHPRRADGREHVRRGVAHVGLGRGRQRSVVGVADLGAQGRQVCPQAERSRVHIVLQPLQLLHHAGKGAKSEDRVRSGLAEVRMEEYDTQGRDKEGTRKGQARRQGR